MREFKVNEYITLRLENNKTMIYVAGERFRQCKYLLLNISVNKISSFDEIESIDEAVEKLDHSLEDEFERGLTIPPEVEFWGHCSNLQVWYEFKYDLRLLHSNLSFPLLQKLSDKGDPLARQVLKEELVRRLIAGAYSVLDLLINRDYIDYFSRAELWCVIEKLQESNFEKYLYFISAKYYFLKKLMEKGDKSAEEIFKKGILKSLSKGFSPTVSYFYERGYIDYLSREEFWSVFGTEGEVLHEIERRINRYKFIDGKKVYKKQFEDYGYFKLQGSIISNSGPMVFTFEEGRVTGIGIFGDGRKVAEASDNYYYGNVYNLEINRLPESIGKLNSQKELILRDLGLKKFPRSIVSLKNLKKLSITGNPQLKLPDFLWDLKSLERLDLSNNNLTTIPDLIEKLENLQELYLYGNNLKSFPLKSIKKLKKLNELCVDIKLAESLDDEIYENLKKILSVS